MRPQSAKAKGRRLQQEVRDAFLKTFPFLQEDDVRSTSMGASGEDILLSPAARACIPFSIECKNTEKLNIHAAIAQASGRRHPPLVVFRKNNTPAYVALPFTNFLELLWKAKAYTDNEVSVGP